jgi:FKBP-type peptidyl-prolyl cis-trans isomerase (trigger factor)
MTSGVSIGETEIKSSEIQKSVDEILTARKTVDTSQMQLVEGPELLRNQAQFIIIKRILDEVAKDKNLSVTSADVASRRADAISRLGGESGLPEALVSANLAASSLDAYLRVLIISDRLISELASSGLSEEEATSQLTKLVTDKAVKLGVKVNTKYGKWNPNTATIEAADTTGGAVTPAP